MIFFLLPYTSLFIYHILQVLFPTSFHLITPPSLSIKFLSLYYTSYTLILLSYILIFAFIWYSQSFVKIHELVGELFFLILFIAVLIRWICGVYFLIYLVNWFKISIPTHILEKGTHPRGGIKAIFHEEACKISHTDLRMAKNRRNNIRTFIAWTYKRF